MDKVLEIKNWGVSLVGWARHNPVAAFLVAAAFGMVIYAFGFMPLYAAGTQPIWEWAWLRFLPQYNQEHSKLIPFLVLFLLWFHRDRIKAAPKKGSNWGLLFVGVGLICFIVAVRALQARVALFGFPFLAFGIVLFIWGKEIARIALFPIALLFFMIPLAAIEQMTFRLQFIIMEVVKILSALFGIGISAVGTSVRPLDGSWGFEISEGCSGIRSLIAMIMITAVYVHLFVPVLWKKILILSFSVLFAIIGNAGRVFTIIVIAELGFPKFAGGMYHDWASQLIFFPIALLSMLGFSKLLNANPAALLKRVRVRKKEKVAYEH